MKNRGTVGTPAGTILDVAFVVDGETVWSDTKTTSLAAGASVTLTANGGENGTNYWIATSGEPRAQGDGQLDQPHRGDRHDQQHAVEDDHQHESSALATTHDSGDHDDDSPGDHDDDSSASPGARQPVLAWLGIVGMNNMLGNMAGGITFDTLRSHSFDGSVISTGHLEASYPQWLITEFTMVKSYGQLYVGANIADPLPENAEEWATFQTNFKTLAAAAKTAGADGMAIDAEPYGFSDVHWQGSDHATFYNQGRLLAPTIKSVGKLIVYPSSNASFPGSYNDLVRRPGGLSGHLRQLEVP